MAPPVDRPVSYTPQSRSVGGRPTDPIEAARQEAYGLARGAVRGGLDPIDASILRALQERSGAGAGPYDQATQAAMMSNAADTAGRIALNARGRVAGSAGDPSTQAALSEIEGRRLAAIQDARRGIDMQANLANYGARGQALGQLGGYNQQVQGNQTDDERFLINMLTREQQTIRTPDVSTGGGIPSFMQYRAPQAPALLPQAGFQPGAMVRGTQPVYRPAVQTQPPVQQQQQAPATNGSIRFTTTATAPKSPFGGTYAPLASPGTNVGYQGLPWIPQRQNPNAPGVYRSN